MAAIDLIYDLEWNLHDLRCNCKTNNILQFFLINLQQGGIVKGLCVKGGADLSRKAIDEYTEFVGRLRY